MLGGDGLSRTAFIRTDGAPSGMGDEHEKGVDAGGCVREAHVDAEVGTMGCSFRPTDRVVRYDGEWGMGGGLEV